MENKIEIYASKIGCGKASRASVILDVHAIDWESAKRAQALFGDEKVLHDTRELPLDAVRFLRSDRTADPLIVRVTRRVARDGVTFNAFGRGPTATPNRVRYSASLTWDIVDLILASLPARTEEEAAAGPLQELKSKYPRLMSALEELDRRRGHSVVEAAKSIESRSKSLTADELVASVVAMARDELFGGLLWKYMLIANEPMHQLTFRGYGVLAQVADSHSEELRMYRGWSCWLPDRETAFASGPECGAEGRLAAEKCLLGVNSLAEWGVGNIPTTEELLG